MLPADLTLLAVIACGVCGNLEVAASSTLHQLLIGGVAAAGVQFVFGPVRTLFRGMRHEAEQAGAPCDGSTDAERRD